MKKLAIVTTHPIQYQVPLFKALKKNGIEAHVFFASKHGLNSKKKDPEFLVKFNWNNNSDLLKGYKSRFSKKQSYEIDSFKISFYKLEKYLKKEKFDALLLFGWNNLHYLKALYFSIKLSIKTILRVETNLNSNSFLIKKFIKFYVLKFFFKNINYFLSIGKLNKKFYLHHGVDKRKIFKAPYFVDNSFFNTKKKRIKIKKKLKFKHKKIILFVGKLIERKKPFDFLRLAEMNKNNQDIHFIMIGDGVLKLDCKNFIKKNRLNNISMPGFVNQKELRNYYRISDLLVLPSIYETWGLVINEAMVSGLPVVCTSNCGASVDLIKKYKTGFIYDEGNILDLYKKVNIVIKKKNLLRKMKKNVKTIISEYSVYKTIYSLKKILNEKKN